MTGVATTHPDVSATYNTVKQQLPTVENIQGFLSSHQMAVTQLAIQYCDALIENNELRSTMFPGFNFSAPAESAFDHGGNSLITSSLMTHFVGDNLASQPTDNEIQTELYALINKLKACGCKACEDDRTKTIVKASCAAVLGSATTLVQ